MTKNQLKISKVKPQSKSIDFSWNTKDYTIYASHKYTKDEGGHQTNQYEDLQNFITAANNSSM